MKLFYLTIAVWFASLHWYGQAVAKGTIDKDDTGMLFLALLVVAIVVFESAAEGLDWLLGWS